VSPVFVEVEVADPPPEYCLGRSRVNPPRNPRGERVRCETAPSLPLVSRGPMPTDAALAEAPVVGCYPLLALMIRSS
jgi:hypothetical protein